MSAIEKNSFVWASLGIEPPLEEDAIYEAGEQPIAGFDNYVQWAITSDIDALNDYAGNHNHEHEAGGSQEINLSGLSVGGAGLLVGHDTTDATEVRIEDADGSGAAPVRIDMDAGVWRAFPDVAVRPTFSEGVALGQHITRDGSVIYDYNEDYFHRAVEAIEADWADEAGDSELFAGNPPEAFIQEGDDVVEPTGEWAYAQTVDADISGNAASADHAEVADVADTADFAYLADDSNHLEGNSLDDILDMVSGDIDESFPAVDDDGSEQLSAATRFDFAEGVDVSASGSTAQMSVTSVAEADEAEYAYNADRLDEYHASDLIAMMGDAGRWTHLTSVEQGGYDWWWGYDLEQTWDRLRVVVHHERAGDGPEQAALAMRLNGDTRQRYHVFEDDYDSGNDWSAETDTRSYFPVGTTWHDKRNVAEYEITAPPVLDTSRDIRAYPEFSLVSGGPPPWIHEIPQRGVLATVYENGVERVAMGTPSGWTSNARIELYGQQIKPDIS